MIQQLEALGLRLDRALHFGQDEDLPKEDTLEFSRLEAWSLPLEGSVWDPNSLSSFWFELVNGAYGDVYRAKALMNLPDGRAFFCNWMVSQGGSSIPALGSGGSTRWQTQALLKAERAGQSPRWQRHPSHHRRLPTQ